MAPMIPFFPEHWFYNTETGQLTQGNNLGNLGNNLLGGLGWHELNIPGNASAARAAAEAKREFPDGAPPTTAGITAGRVVNQAAKDAGGFAGNLLGIPTLSNLRDLMVRVVKVVGGLALVFIGLNRMTSMNIDLSSAIKSAAKIGAVA